MSVAEACQALGIDPTASGRLTDQEIDARFREAARHTHPDRGGDQERFDRSVRARSVLRRRRPHGSTPASPRSGTTRPTPPVVVIDTTTWWERILRRLFPVDDLPRSKRPRDLR